MCETEFIYAKPSLLRNVYIYRQIRFSVYMMHRLITAVDYSIFNNVHKFLS